MSKQNEKNDAKATSGDQNISANKQNKKTMKDARKKEKKSNGFIEYVRGVFTEMRRVTWPSRAETLKWSAVVLISLIFFGAFVMLLDNFVVTPFLYFISGIPSMIGI